MRGYVTNSVRSACGNSAELHTFVGNDIRFSHERLRLPLELSTLGLHTPIFRSTKGIEAHTHIYPRKGTDAS